MKLYKATSANGASCFGGSGKWHLPKGKRPGKWMPRIEEIEVCCRGYHLCGRKDLIHWIGEAVWEAESHGKIIRCDDHVVAQQARLVRRLNWNDRVARLFACDCAERVQKFIDAENRKITKSTIDVARRFADGSVGHAARSAARKAAESAAESAARSAARSEAWGAAWSAAESAAWSATWGAARSAAWRAAESAARSAARSEAWGAAWSAAWGAAWSAAWRAAESAEKKWQTKRLFDYLTGKRG